MRKALALALLLPLAFAGAKCDLGGYQLMNAYLKLNYLTSVSVPPGTYTLNAYVTVTRTLVGQASSAIVTVYHTLTATLFINNTISVLNETVTNAATGKAKVGQLGLPVTVTMTVNGYAYLYTTNTTYTAVLNKTMTRTIGLKTVNDENDTFAATFTSVVASTGTIVVGAATPISVVTAAVAVFQASFYEYFSTVAGVPAIALLALLPVALKRRKK